MVQIINMGPSRGALQASQLGQGLQSLSQGLGAFYNNYTANKDFEELENNPEYKDLPYSERMEKAQQVTRKHGKLGEKLFNQKQQIEQIRQQEQAFKKLKNLDLENKTPQQVIGEMSEALQYHPRGGEMMAAMLPYILNQKNATDYGKNLDPNDLNVNGTTPQGNGAQQEQPVQGQSQPPPMQSQPPASMPYSEEVQQPVNETPVSKTNIPNRMNAQNIKTTSDEFLKDLRPDLLGQNAYGTIPSFNFESKSDLRPAEEAQVRQKLSNKGVLKETQDQIVDRLREDIKNEYNLAKDRYNLNNDQRQAIQEKWNVFRNQAEGERGLLTPFIQQFTTGDEKNPKPLLNTQNDLRDKYFQYAGDLRTDLTPEQMHAQALGKLQNDIKEVQALQNIPSAPPFRGLSDMDSYLKDYKKSVQPLLKKGMIGTVEDDAYFNKDLGVEETHHVIWGDQTSKPLMNEIGNIPFPQRTPERNAFISDKQVSRYVDDVSKKLMKMSPEDDLILMRAGVLKNDPENGYRLFNDALDKAQENGLELSQFQEKQLGQVKTPRAPAMWEFFTWDGYTKGWNLIRGKK